MPPSSSMTTPSSLLAKLGVVATTTVKHVPTRMVLWAAIGFVVGSFAVALSYVVGVLVMGRGALVLGYFAAIPLALPPLGGFLFGMHGLHRGAARAALALEAKLGLVEHVVERVLVALEHRVGDRLANLPLDELEAALRDAVSAYLGAPEDDGRGWSAYVLRRARAAIARRIDTYLLVAYREERRADGSGGGVALDKVRARVGAALSAQLGGVLMSSLNRQLAVLATLFLVLAGGWWFWLYLAFAAVRKATG